MQQGCEARLLHTLTQTPRQFLQSLSKQRTIQKRQRAQRAAHFRRGTTLPPSVLFAFSFATPHASERESHVGTNAHHTRTSKHAAITTRNTPAHSVSRRRTSLGAACIRRSTHISARRAEHHCFARILARTRCRLAQHTNAYTFLPHARLARAPQHASASLFASRMKKPPGSVRSVRRTCCHAAAHPAHPSSHRSFSICHVARPPSADRSTVHQPARTHGTNTQGRRAAAA